MTIFVVLKVALQQYGEYTLATAERAFRDKPSAEAYLKTVPAAWTETISDVLYACERAVTEVELEE